LVRRLVAEAIYDSSRRTEPALTACLLPEDLATATRKMEETYRNATSFYQVEFYVRTSDPEACILELVLKFLYMRSDSDEPAARERSLQVTLAQLLKSHIVKFEEPVEEDKKLVLTASARHATELGVWKVTFIVVNGSKLPKSQTGRHHPKTIWDRTFYCVRGLITVRNGEFIPPESEEHRELEREAEKRGKFEWQCHCINCTLVTSKLHSNPVLFFTQLIAIWRRQYKAEEVDYESELKARKDLPQELKDILFKVIGATGFKKLRRFQLTALIEVAKKLWQGKGGAVAVKAPTGLGKSAVYYMAAGLAALIEDLKGRGAGTKAIFFFPTRALNAQQFTQIIEYLYRLNQEVGAPEDKPKFTVGLYMGVGEDLETAIRPLSPTQVKDGDPLPPHLIGACPKCKGSEFIVRKEGPNRIIPVCKNDNCGYALRFVYLTNDETRSYCPTIVIATPDMLLSYHLPRSDLPHALVGAPSRRCNNCGAWFPLSYQAARCMFCGGELSKKVFQSAPSIIVFDEYHVLTGLQGNLTAHLLGALERLMQLYGFGRPVYIAATATAGRGEEELLGQIFGTRRGEVSFVPNDGEWGAYFKREENPSQLILIVDPVWATVKKTVSWWAVNYCDLFRQTLEGINDPREAERFKRLFKTMAIYVLSKMEGSSIDGYIPDLARSHRNISTINVRFAHGDLQPAEIIEINKQLKDAVLDVFITTLLYAYGVHFPTLNVITFYGTPKSFIELTQVLGRVGREISPERGDYALVSLLLYPQTPRDRRVFRYARRIFESMEEQLREEPMPLNALNPEAVSLSMPNAVAMLLIGLLITKITDLVKAFKYRIGDPLRTPVLKSLLRSRQNLDKLESEIIEAYVKRYDGIGFKKEELDAARQRALTELYRFLRKVDQVGNLRLSTLVNEDGIATLRGKEDTVAFKLPPLPEWVLTTAEVS